MTPNPFTYKPAELRKACARAGVSPIGNADELLEGLITHLRQRPAPPPAPFGHHWSRENHCGGASDFYDAKIVFCVEET